jgi:Cache domain
MFWSNEKIKLVPVISILLITGFLVTSLASYFVSRASLRSEIAVNTLPLTSDNIYSEIQRDLLRPIFISSVMANDTFLRDWVLNGEAGESQIRKYLNEIQTKYNAFTSFFVSEKTRTYYHAGGILKKISPDEERDAWYFRVKNLKEDYEINVDPDLANKDEMTIFINFRVFDYNNNYIGATGVGLTVNAVKKLIEIYQQKYDRNIYFIDKKGDIKQSGSGFDRNIKNISQLEYHSQFKNDTALHAGQSFTYKKNGRVLHTNIRYIEEFKWYLVVEQPEQATIKKIFRALWINIFICIFVTIFILILVNMSINAYTKKIDTLRGIVPICSFCKQIRDDKGYWNKVEAYVSKHTEAKFSHGICPECMDKHYPKN